MSHARLAAFGLAVLSTFGCGGALRFDARVVHPARLSISASQSIAVVHGSDPAARRVAEGLVDALRARGVMVDGPTARIDDVPVGTSRLLYIDVVTSVTLRTEWTTRPENVCGPYGCYVRNVSQPYEMPYVVARFDARIADVGSRAIIEAYAGSTEVAGVEDSLGLRRVAARVVERLLAGMSPVTERVRVAFEPFDDETAEHVVIDVRDGRFDDARSRLEPRLADASLDDEARARLHYDLALVITFDPATQTRPSGLAEALEHAEASVRLDPTRRHVAILERVRAMVDESRRTNGMRLEADRPTESLEGVPAVPDAYRGEIPPPPP